jgi:hypothetical protein
MTSGRKIAFDRIADEARARAALIVPRRCPDGKKEGVEWAARNPRRADRKPGSFKVNLTTGKWGDWSSGDKGGDLISLAAYLFGLNQVEAAKRVADMLGISAYDN